MLASSPSRLTSFNCLSPKAPVFTGATLALEPMRFNALDWFAVLLAVPLRVEGHDGSPPPAVSGSRLLLELMPPPLEGSVSRCISYFPSPWRSVMSMVALGEFGEDVVKNVL